MKLAYPHLRSFTLWDEQGHDVHVIRGMWRGGGVTM